MTTTEEAYELIAKGVPKARGYRIIVKPLDAVEQLEAKEAEMFPTLAKSGFKAKTAEQQERESKGSDHGIVISVGNTAYDRLGENWCKVGDVIIFHRYAGKRIELPPGSGEFLQFINDEDVFGAMV